MRGNHLALVPWPVAASLRNILTVYTLLILYPPTLSTWPYCHRVKFILYIYYVQINIACPPTHVIIIDSMIYIMPAW